MKIQATIFVFGVSLLSLLPFVKADEQKFPDPKIVAELAAASPTQEELVLTLTADKDYYLVGEKITLSATLKNTGKENKKLLLASYGNLVRNYSVHLYAVTKKELAITPDGNLKLLDDRSVYSRSMTLVKPGEEVKDAYSSLNQLYDIATPGTYQLTISRDFPKNKGNKERTTLTSNIVEITVGTTPPPTKPDADAPKPPNAAPAQ